MKLFKFVFIVVVFVISSCPLVLSKSSSTSTSTRVDDRVHKGTKAVLAVPNAFRVKGVIFQKVVFNNTPRLVAVVKFNKNIDASTVQENFNIRMIKKNENHFWLDASTQNNVVRVRPNFITWVSGAPFADGYYKMLLRGTIKSSDGIYLDCDGDGKGEGGYLPDYESQLFQINMNSLIGIDPERLKDLIDRL
ncbi:MAG: hypothetical protein GY729_01205 [Desulfobacteraceae bacterium]|nr:hypothetical protein [Desulfobacteraceae bacterium]